MSAKRVALVVGINTYSKDPLGNAVSDARVIAKTLKNRGFVVNIITDPSGDGIVDALAELDAESKNADMALFYFAGHGVELNGSGYLLASDFEFPLTPSKLAYCGIPTSKIFESIRNSQTPKVIVIDACRKEANEVNEAEIIEIGKSLIPIRALESKSNNLIISYSTSSGEVASDGLGENSVFCTKFCEITEKHEISIENAFKEIGFSVMRATEGRQRPWYYSSMDSDIRFSDIDVFQLVQTHRLPQSGEAGHSPAMAGVHQRADVIVTPGNNIVFMATISHPMMSTLRMDSPVQDVSFSEIGSIFAIDEEGRIVLSDNGKYYSCKPALPSPAYRVFSSKDGRKIVLIGHYYIYVYSIGCGKIQKVRNYNLKGWSVYTAAFISDTEVWAAGDNGRIAILDISGSRELKIINDENRGTIYSLDYINDDRVVLVGDFGRVSVYSASEKVKVSNFELPSVSQLSVTRRESLRNSVQAEMITDFLYHPYRLTKSQLRHCNDRLPQNQLSFCSVSKYSPIIAIGSSEGIIYLVDYRDGQRVQTIDACSGRGTRIEGLQFIFGGVLAVLTRDCYLLHYSNVNVPGAFEELSTIELPTYQMKMIFGDTEDNWHLSSGVEEEAEEEE